MWNVLIAWLIADLGSGLVHWWEDRYGNPEWPWPLGEHVVKPNIEHHEKPHIIVCSSYLSRNATTLVTAAPLAIIFFACGWYAVAVGFLWLSQANEIHAWSHQKCSRPIRILQAVGLLLSPKKHMSHHQQPFDKNYCVCTDYLNPILEGCEFWSRLETVIWLVAGISPNPRRFNA